jgi:hypothetical protein
MLVINTLVLMFTTMPPSDYTHCVEKVKQFYILSSREPMDYITKNHDVNEM